MRTAVSIAHKHVQLQATSRHSRHPLEVFCIHVHTSGKHTMDGASKRSVVLHKGQFWLSAHYRHHHKAMQGWPCMWQMVGANTQQWHFVHWAANCMGPAIWQCSVFDNRMEGCRDAFAAAPQGPSCTLIGASETTLQGVSKSSCHNRQTLVDSGVYTGPFDCRRAPKAAHVNCACSKWDCDSHCNSHVLARCCCMCNHLSVCQSKAQPPGGERHPQ